MFDLKTFAASCAVVLVLSIMTSPATAAVISQTTDAAGSGTVDLTAQGTQDWVLIEFNGATDMFETNNTKNGGSGITLGAGFGVDVSGASSGATLSAELRGPDDYEYTDGTSPGSGDALQMNVARAGINLNFADLTKSYEITFDAIAVGVEHTATVYTSNGRTQWSDISATWANPDPGSLTNVLDNDLDGRYILTYTPDALTDAVTVTFTVALGGAASGNPTIGSNASFRAGITGATLAVIPEPTSGALISLASIGIVGFARRRKS